MRYKVVPEPADVDTLAAVHEAVPLVPGSVEDCCTRIRDATDVPSRDRAREWLTFLEALDVAEETPRGYRRVRTDPREADLGAAFERRVFGAAELLDALVDGPLSVEAGFERLHPVVPEWERDRHADWEAEWRERTRRLLEWAEAFGLATRDGDRYDLAEGYSRSPSRSET